MIQLTFEHFNTQEKEHEANVSSLSPKEIKEFEPVIILKDFKVAWLDRDWILHEQDLVYLDPQLVAILVERGIARKTPLSESAKKEGQTQVNRENMANPAHKRQGADSEVGDDASPLTAEDGDIYRDQLLNLGFILNPSLCGESLDRKHYRIAVHKPSDIGKHQKLQSIMARAHFSQVNTGTHGPLIFTRPLRRDPA